MKLLSVETSCRRASAAVLEGGTCLAELFADEGRKHAETLMPLIERTLAEAGVALADVDAFVVGSEMVGLTRVRSAAGVYISPLPPERFVN